MVLCPTSSNVIEFHGAVPSAALPVICGDGERPIKSGWVIYSNFSQARMHFGPRSFGRTGPTGINSHAGTVKSSTNADKSPPLALVPIAPNDIGRVVDTQRILTRAASNGVPLDKVAALQQTGSADVDADSSTGLPISSSLLRAAAMEDDEEIVRLYHEVIGHALSSHGSVLPSSMAWTSPDLNCVLE